MRRAATTALIGFALVVAVCIPYAQVAGHEFVSFDDSIYVFNNLHVRSGFSWEGFQWALTSFHASNWHPLTWLSHMTDCQLFGLDPSAHHLVNLGLHAANTVLLFLALRLMTGTLWAPAFVAALFGLHPLRVESVAWVSERKDVLSALFWMLTLLAYGWYVRRPGIGRYSLLFASFGLGLTAKPMLVTLPVVLLLLDIWPLHRWRRSERWRIVAEKLPLLGLALASSAVTLIVKQRTGGLSVLEKIPFPLRAENALVSYAAYLKKTFWPTGLAVFYPHAALVSNDPSSVLLGPAIAAALLLTGISALALYTFKTRPYVAVGWLWYLVTLLPVIGIVQVGEQALADRYTYLPLVGIYIALSWGARDVGLRWPRSRPGLVLAGVAGLTACATLTWFQVATWRSTTTLFEHAVEVTRDNYLAHTSLGSELVYQGKPDEAREHYELALASKPDYLLALSGLATTYSMQGRHAEAEALSRRALVLQPASPDLLNNLGAALYQQGKIEEAAEQFERAVAIRPSAMSHTNIGGMYLLLGRPDQAASHLEQALLLDPDSLEAHLNLGGLRARQGNLDGAAIHFEAALRIQPGNPDALNALTSIRAARGR